MRRQHDRATTRDLPELTPSRADPLELLAPFWPTLPTGPVLDLGPGSSGRNLSLLAPPVTSSIAVDFHPVDVVESLISYGKGLASEAGAVRRDCTIHIAYGSVALLIADSVLGALPPGAGERLLARIKGLTRPGGIVYAAARTTADPSHESTRSVGQSAGRNTYRTAGAAEVCRFFATGELAMAFADWSVLRSGPAAYEAPWTEAGYQVDDVVIARRPTTGTILA